MNDPGAPFRRMPGLLLGIEGGGTRTVALLVRPQHPPLPSRSTDRATETEGPAQGAIQSELVRRIETGPGNVRLLTDRQLVNLFRSLRIPARDLAAIAIGAAGARHPADRRRLKDAAARVWPGVPVHATNDLETALAAASAPNAKPGTTRVLVLSGTGACCFGRSPTGATAKVDGWGQWLGDRGSAHAIGSRALRSVFEQLDRTGRWPALGGRLLRKVLLNEPDDLIAWAQRAGKEAVAGLAVEVFEAAALGDTLARRIVEEAATELAANALNCARRLVRRDQPVDFIFAGGTLLRQPQYARQVARRLHAVRPAARILRLEREGAWGAVALAAAQAAATNVGTRTRSAHGKSPSATEHHRKRPGSAAPSPPELAPSADIPTIVHPAGAGERGLRPPPERNASTALPSSLSPTEQRHPRSRNLHQRSLASAIHLFLDEETVVAPALQRVRRKLAQACEWIVHALAHGGRLIYLGAGTSGRLGVLDASECPPTFRTPPELVQGIIAGGQTALWEAVEGAEDDADAGARAVTGRGIGARDLVVGIAASGRTPFVWGGLACAHERGATTVLLCFNPAVRPHPQGYPDLVIAPDVGPELLTGSTRLKCGTATKIVLNLFSTLAMVRLGKVVSNLMVDLNPSNVKLRDRATRIVGELTGANAEQARAILERSGWRVSEALRRLGATRAPGRS